jgi:hypothetical protein
VAQGEGPEFKPQYCKKKKKKEKRKRGPVLRPFSQMSTARCLTFPLAGRPPDQFGHQHLFWWQFYTWELLFGLQPKKKKRF